MKKQHAQWPLEDSHQQLIALVRQTANVVRQGENARQIALKHSDEGWVSAVYATRCTKNLRAIAILCEAGYGGEAAHIVRGMLEDAVTVAYIAEDMENRARQYVSFEETRAYFYMKEALGAGLIDETSQRARELTHKFADTAELDTLWWAGLKPGSMAGRLRGTNRPLKRDFFALYPLLSDDAHGNAMMAGNYVVEDTDGTPLALVDVPTQHRIDDMTCLAIYCAWRLAQAAEACGLGVRAADVAALFEQASAIYREPSS